MRNGIHFAIVACLVLGISAPVNAGCVKGAAVGAVAGHLVGHHAVLGAVAGCVVGHHIAVKKKRQEELQKEQQHATAPAQGTQGVTQTHQPAP